MSILVNLELTPEKLLMSPLLSHQVNKILTPFRVLFLWNNFAYILQKCHFLFTIEILCTFDLFFTYFAIQLCKITDLLLVTWKSFKIRINRDLDSGTRNIFFHISTPWHWPFGLSFLIRLQQ